MATQAPDAMALWNTLPRYFIVGERPVKVLRTRDGGVQLLAYDWTSGDFTSDPSYMSRIFFGDGSDVDEVAESDFEAQVEQLKSGR